MQLRGIPALRYQGEGAFSLEGEVRREITKRWSVLGFAGVGFADDKFANLLEDEQFVWGGGFRYLIARKLGLHVGVDVARGPEQTVVYLQIGTAWQMD